MEKTKIDLPDEVQKIIASLEKNGHAAYVVGGCVRDKIMGKTPHDWDITTSASPEETEKIFFQNKLVLNGMKHGTVGVVENGEVYEVTTFRTESAYSDNRHPDSVTFVNNIEDDLARRDFTVNSIAYSPKTGLVDPFGGKEDIKKKIIRCVGQAGRRFDEDALRIMRAVRFSSTLGFEIEEKTSRKIHEKKSLLKNVSTERIRDELEKLLGGKNVFDVLKNYSDVIFSVIPELSYSDGWETVCKGVEASENEIGIRLALIMQNLSKDDTLAVLKRLKFDNKTTDEVSKLVEHCAGKTYEKTDELPFLINRFGYDFLRNLVKVSKAKIIAQNGENYKELFLCDEFLKKLDECEEKNICVFVSQLDVDGNDLKQLGFEGKSIGTTLNECLKKVMRNELENDRDTLIEYVKSLNRTTDL